MWNRYFSTKVDIDLRYWCKRINCGRRCWYSIPSFTFIYFFPYCFFFRIYLRSLPFERMPFTLMMCLLLSPLSGLCSGVRVSYLIPLLWTQRKAKLQLKLSSFLYVSFVFPFRTFCIGNQRSYVFFSSVRPSPSADKHCDSSKNYMKWLHEKKEQLRIRFSSKTMPKKEKTDFLFRSSFDPILFAIRQSNNVDYSNVANGQHNFCVAIFCNLCNAFRSSFFIRSICRSLQLFYLAAFQNFALKSNGFACVWKMDSVNALKWR